LIGFLEQELAEMENNISGSLGLHDKELQKAIKQVVEGIGAENMPHAMIFFESDGTISSMCAPEDILGEDNVKSAEFALDYVHYAFSRADWMLDFIKQTQMSTQENTKPALKLIKGGLDDKE